ncbi:TRAP transporter solute receptor, TAXI family precursor [hydrothermal vent metagenome]|uniref:TRAP transporter solute receptor, TAXI family n=1 Tax=hydrothermal vent metagenome TaxID=652676 RepID=A0A3B1C4H7_9ZZZZ
MKRGSTLLALALATALFVSTCPAHADNKRRFITIGSGSVTGVYYPIAGAISKIVNKQRKKHGIRATVESTGGSAYNVNSMSIGEMDMGIVQSDVGFRAYNGVGDFKGRKIGKLRSILSLHPEPFHIIASEKSGIKTFNDLKGKRVNIGNPGSGQRSSSEALFSVTPFGLEDMTVESLKGSEAPDYLRDGRIDAFFYTVGIGSASIMDIASAHVVKVISIDDSVLDKLKKGRPYFVPVDIPGGVYPHNPDPVRTFAVKATLLTTTDLANEVVYSIVKSIYENFDEFIKTHPALALLAPEDTLKGMSAPFHPGALKYYKERGWIK